MQEIVLYGKVGNNSVTFFSDENLTKKEDMPALMRGLEWKLTLNLFNAKDEPWTLPAECVKWGFVLDNDWNAATAPMVTTREISKPTSNRLEIIIRSTNTVEMAKALGDKPEAKFGAELTGYAEGKDDAVMVLQWKDVSVQNRRGNIGTPEPQDIPVIADELGKIRERLA